MSGAPPYEVKEALAADVSIPAAWLTALRSGATILIAACATRSNLLPGLGSGNPVNSPFAPALRAHFKCSLQAAQELFAAENTSGEKMGRREDGAV